MKSRHLLSQYFKGLKHVTTRTKNLKKAFNLYKGMELNKLEQRFMTIWLKKIKTQKYYEHLFKWTFIQVKRGILKNYYKDLKQYSKYKQLKRMSP